MSSQRITRVNELLRREIGTTLFRVINEADCDLSAVSVTHVVAASDLHTAKVLVSIRGDSVKQRRILSILRKHRVDIQELINKNVILKYTPRLSFSLDTSLAEGDHVLDILRGLEEEPSDDPAV